MSGICHTVKVTDTPGDVFIKEGSITYPMQVVRHFVVTATGLVCGLELTAADRGNIQRHLDHVTRT